MGTVSFHFLNLYHRRLLKKRSHSHGLLLQFVNHSPNLLLRNNHSSHSSHNKIGISNNRSNHNNKIGISSNHNNKIGISNNHSNHNLCKTYSQPYAQVFCAEVVESDSTPIGGSVQYVECKMQFVDYSQSWNSPFEIKSVSSSQTLAFLRTPGI